MSDLLVIVLLLLAGVAGWIIGQKRVKNSTSTRDSSIPRDYFIGLNYLLNEEPDKAVDVFINMITVDSDTVETHFALGNLFRRRGEVERAIRIHQNLIARPHLSKEFRVQALLELGQDYFRAGVFDRAEKLFLEVIESGEQITPSLKYLLDIYQQEKDWEQAIEIAQKMSSSSQGDIRPIIAHYYCELASRSKQQDNIEVAGSQVARALTIDRKCVRASLLQAELELRDKNYKAAIRYYKRVKNQDPDFISETITPLIQCYQQLEDNKGMINYFRQCLEDHPRISIVLVFVDKLCEEGKVKVATEFLAQQLQRRPSIKGLERLINLHIDNEEGKARDNLLILRDINRQVITDKPVYQCRRCGYSSRTLIWQCPSCRNWNTVKPILGLEGD